MVSCAVAGRSPGDRKPRTFSGMPDKMIAGRETGQPRRGSCHVGPLARSQNPAQGSFQNDMRRSGGNAKFTHDNVPSSRVMEFPPLPAPVGTPNLCRIGRNTARFPTGPAWNNLRPAAANRRHAAIRGGPRSLTTSGDSGVQCDELTGRLDYLRTPAFR
jgi:hypothetical protein